VIAASVDAASSSASNFVPSMSSLLTTYELGERLGPGRLGSDVYRGVHRALGHPVAIRVLRRDSERSWEGVRARLLREARTLQVAHPSVIRCATGEEADMALRSGRGSHRQSLRGCSLPLELLAAAQAAAHCGGAALHRRQGLLCGMSLEIMRVAPASDDDAERLMISSAGIWQAQDLLVTPTSRRRAEQGCRRRTVLRRAQLTGQSADVRSDIFTMGVLAYEMATARRPYEGTSMPALLGAMLRGTVDDPRIAQPELPPAAAAAIYRALRPFPADRFATAKQFGEPLFSE
jgi:serine/threonine-protein kinase